MKAYYLMLGLCLASTFTFAQSRLQGIVSDPNGQALPGASVLLDNSAIGTITDLEGRYEIMVPSDTRSITFSFTGYQRQTLPYSGNSELNVRLEEGVGLGEVVVTALGLRRENAELGYAVSSIEGREISDVAATNFLDNLAGQVAGVNVVTGPTGVGSTSLVSIRGESSFTGNTPLYVVDGIPIDNRSILNVTNELSAGYQEVDFGGGNPEISPFDVESVSVLKGPAAAALYGTRAANGVIIINTKPGGARPGLGVEVNSQTSLDRPFRLPQFQNLYGQGRSGKFAYVDGAGGGTQDGISFSYGPRLDAGVLTTQFDSPVLLADGTTVRAGDLALYDSEPVTPTPFVSHPNNVSDFYQTGVTSTNNISLSQGFKGGDYRLSFTDLRSDSYIPNVDLNRNNVAARLNFRPTDKVEVSAGMSYINSRSDNRPASGYGSENLNYTLTAWLGRSTDLESLRNYWQPGLEGQEQFSFNTSFFDNPFFILNENRNSFNRDRVLGYLQARVQLTPKLDLRLRSGMDQSSEQREMRRAYSSNRFRRGAYSENNLSFRERNNDVLLTYSSKVGDLKYALSAGANRLDQRAETEQIQADALTVPGVYRLTNAAIPLVSFGQQSERRINSAYGLLRLSWQNKLFMDLTGRNDWSSSLATPTSAEGTSFFYPSASLSWIASESLRLPQTISYLQFRASVAQVGNDTDPYRTGGSFVAGTPVNGTPTYTNQSEIPAVGILPERATAYEFGAAVRLFDDKLGLDVTAYSQLNEDQILALPTPISSGYQSRVVNGGSVRARGLEIGADARLKLNRQIRYQTRVNFTSSYAEVISLPDDVQQATLAYSRVYNNPGQTVYYIAEKGGRIGDMYGTSYLRNEQGEYVVSSKGAFIADNRLKKIGNYVPDFVVGWSNQVMCKNFLLDWLVDWRQGGEIVSRTQALAGYSGQLAETANRPEEGIIIPGVMNTGTAETPNYVPNTVAIPAEDYYISYFNREHEEHNTLDASFVKLREVKLGYRIAGRSNKSFFGEQANLTVAVFGRNLLAWTATTHIDPEQYAVQGQRFVRGVEDMSYPTPKSVGISINASF